MVTKNFANFTNALKSIVTSNTNYVIVQAYIKDLEGTIKNQSSAFYNAMQFIQNGSTNLLANIERTSLSEEDSTLGVGMFVGSGDTSPTSDDFKLESVIPYASDGLSIINKSVTYGVDSNTLCVYTYTLKNNSDSPIIISESGIIILANLNSTSAVQFLLARDTFDSVILEPGQTRAFTMTIGLE